MAPIIKPHEGRRNPGRGILHLRAPAKVNLRLEVLGLREDGYHELRTWIYPIGLWDEIVLERIRKGLKLRCDHPEVPEDDLCLKAARLFFEQTGIRGGVRVTLVKGIPVGAGLGGGSSDAAAVLKGLCALWGLDLPEERLMAMGQEIGSDVPFFLRGRPALVAGRGERILQELPPLGLPLVILFPGRGLSTAEVYRRFDLSLTKPRGENKIIKDFPPRDWKGFVWNDLEPVAKEMMPEIGEMEEALLRAGAKAAGMTGSGSAVFGVFGTEEEARVALRALGASRWKAYLALTF